LSTANLTSLYITYRASTTKRKVEKKSQLILHDFLLRCALTSTEFLKLSLSFRRLQLDGAPARVL
jgi:hypothetical protein